MRLVICYPFIWFLAAIAILFILRIPYVWTHQMIEDISGDSHLADMVMENLLFGVIIIVVVGLPMFGCWWLLREFAVF